MNLKECIASDLENLFFNQNEFAEEVNIDGKSMIVVTDNDFLKKYNLKNGGEGLENSELLFHVKISDLDDKPFIGKHMEFNNDEYQITNVQEAEGVYIIMLGRVTSWR